MQKLFVPEQSSFAELDLEQFKSLRYSVCILDFNWKYLYVNNFVSESLGDRGKELAGKNIWDYFPELATDPAFLRMKNDIEKGAVVNFNTTSPITNQRLNVVGYPLKDCYFFYASQLPNKEDLMNELRSVLDKEKPDYAGTASR